MSTFINLHVLLILGALASVVFGTVASDVWSTSKVTLYDAQGASSSISVSISESYAIVGDLSKQKAYIYERNASTGLFSGSGAPTVTIAKSGLDFANAVALTDNYAAVAADNQKKVFVFTRDLSQGWMPLTSNEEEISLSINRFGYSLAMTDDFLIVGSANAGVAVYTRSATLGWKTTPQMLDLGNPGVTFTTSVDISNKYAIVGGNQNVWIFYYLPTQGNWDLDNAATTAIKANAMSITTTEPSVSVSDKLAVYGDPDRANTQDHVFVLSFDSKNVMPWITDPGYGVGVAITDDYLAVTASGVAPTVYLIQYPEQGVNSGAKVTQETPAVTASPLNGMVVSFSSNANSVIVGDSSNGMGYIYHRGCPAGRKSSSVGCVDCTGGTYSFAAADACTDCAAGTYSEDKAMQCKTCAAGKVANSTAASECTLCDPGKYSAQPTYCRTCEKGKYSTGGSGACIDCEAGKFSNALGTTNCQDCDRGFFSGKGLAECTPCPAGEVSSNLGMSACTPCDSGYSPSPGRWECLPCQAGTFANSTGTASCMSCRAGTYSKRQASTCLPCAGGKYSDSQASKCTSCTPGEYSGAGYASCGLCFAGSYSLAKADDCTPCPRSTYTSEMGTGKQCLPCPPGRITPGIGSADLGDCLDPASNFVLASFSIPIALALAFVYLIRGRFKVIAFYRRERVARKLTETSRAISAYIYQYIYDAEVRRVYITSYRTLRVVVFYSLGLLVSLFMTLMVTLILFAKVIFKAMIVVVSLDADFAFVNKIRTFAQNLALILGFPGLKAIIQPFADLIEYLVVFRLDFGFVNLTCEGSTSPMKLIVALFVMGVVIVIVQSNIALFKTITYDTLTRKFTAAVFASRYRIWDPSIFDNLAKGAAKLRVVFPARLYAFHWLRSAFFSVITVLLSSLQIFQIIPQYLASRVDLGDFIGRNYSMHEYDDSCNVIEGFLNFDTGIAVAASVIAWLLLVPAIYEISNILIPGIPSTMKLNYLELHTYDADYGKHSTYVLRAWWACMSLLAPDLWVADAFQLVSKTICRRTPYKAGLCSPSVAQVERLIREEDPTRARNFIFGEQATSARLEEGPGGGSNTLVNSYVLNKDNARKEILEMPSELFYRLMLPRGGSAPFRLFHSTRLVNTSHIWSEMDISDSDKLRGFYALLLVDPASGINMLCKTYRPWSPKDWASTSELSSDLENAPLHCGIILVKYGTHTVSAVANAEKRLLDSLKDIDLLTFEWDDEDEEEEEEEVVSEQEKRLSQRDQAQIISSKILPKWAPDARTRAMDTARKTFKSPSNRALFTLAQNVSLAGGNVRNLAHSTTYVMIGSPKVHLESKARSFERWVTAADETYEQSYEGPTLVTEHNLRSKMAHDITFTFRAPPGGIVHAYDTNEDDGLPVEGEGEYGGEYGGEYDAEAVEYAEETADAYDDDGLAGENKDGSKEEDEDEIDDGITGETETTKWRLHDKNHNHDLCLGSDSYTLHSLKRRTDQEKIAWRDYSRRELPSYFVLCVLEVEEVQGVHSSEFSEAYPKWLREMPTALLLVLCLLGCGHLSTYCGRRAMYTVAWKYYRFVLLCFGFWTQDLTDYFMVHKTLRNHSLVWEHPEYKMNQAYKGESTSADFEADDRYSASHSGKSQDNGGAKAKAEAEAKEKGKSGEGHQEEEESFVDTFNLHLHHSTETPELMSLPEQELKMVYANDYQAAVSTLVATRATLLQVVPALAILSVFADLMAGTPLLVQDKKLALSLPELIAKDPFGKARRMEAEFTGTVNQMRQGDMSNEDDCATIPGHVASEIGPERLEQVQEFNRNVKEGLTRSLQQPPLLIKEWVVTLKGISYFYYQSRLIQFVFQLFTFLLVVTLLFMPVGSQKSFIYAALAVFLPRGIIVGLDVAVAFGKILCITDEDLRIFWCGGEDGGGGGGDGTEMYGEYADDDDNVDHEYARKRESSAVDFASVYGMSMSEAMDMHGGGDGVDHMTENPLAQSAA